MEKPLAIAVANSECAVDFFCVKLIPTKTEAKTNSPGVTLSLCDSHVRANLSEICYE